MRLFWVRLDKKHILIGVETAVDDAVFDHQFVRDIVVVFVDDAVVTVSIGMVGITADNDSALPLYTVVRLIENKATAAFPLLSRPPVQVVFAPEIG